MSALAERIDNKREAVSRVARPRKERVTPADIHAFAKDRHSKILARLAE